MSFILEQLKKSGKKRALELAMRNQAATRGRKTEGLPHTDYESTSGSKVPKSGIYLTLLLAVLVFSAVGGFMLFYAKTGNRHATVTRSKDKNHAAPAVQKSENVQQKTEFPMKRTESAPTGLTSKTYLEKAAPAPAISRKLPEKIVKHPISPKAIVDTQPQAQAAVQEQAAAPLPQEKPVPPLDDLPTPLKKALPPIHITSHLYRGNSRLVNINGRIMSEGVTMEDGLFLEKITPEGVILSFRGHRFRVRAD
ncbi:MAG: hypothetical protein C0402_14055 [Thermodesulfovibrio sp.]|nr:hypothetical protein [Thermodesulfovibrio sp.]